MQELEGSLHHFCGHQLSCYGFATLLEVELVAVLHELERAAEVKQYAAASMALEALAFQA